MSTPTPSAPPATAKSSSDDFPDCLSPMLVKELRQGLRARSFLAVFIGLQGFLCLILFISGGVAGSNSVGGVISGIIFACLCLAVLIIQPMRGVASLATEMKGNTLDMMVLTRLNARRILLGKWTAIVGQSALLVAAILPYLILRYFLGGMNLFAELVFLCLVFLSSMAFTAVTVGLSGCTSSLLRGLLPLFGVPFLFFGLIGMTFGGGFPEILRLCSLDDADSRIAVGLYVACLAYLGSTALSLGTSLIAPAAENHSTRRRLVALCLLLLLLPVSHFTPLDAEMLVVLVGIIAVPAIAIALSEHTPLLPVTVEPFTRRGPVGRLAALALLPGWASGSVYTAIMALASLAILMGSELTYGMGDSEAVLCVAVLGTLLLPAAIQALTFKVEGQRVANYILLLLIFTVLSGVLAGTTAAMNSESLLWFFSWIPLVLFPLHEETSSKSATIMAVGVLLCGAYLIFLLLRGLPSLLAALKGTSSPPAPESTPVPRYETPPEIP